MKTKVRRPVVAGSFYPAESERLASLVGSLMSPCEKTDATGIISPHAGLIYSGAVAAAVFSSIRVPETVLLLGPNHTGFGSPASLMKSGVWSVPTGNFRINEHLASLLLEESQLIMEDDSAHLFEHSLEVQLPFLSTAGKPVEIVPVTFMQLSIEECIDIASSVATAIRKFGRKVLMVASSDMSHYLPDEEARKKDQIAIEKILELDPEGLFETVRKFRITMCGYIPATIMLSAARLLGVKSARVLKYATSGEVSGDYNAVVGYAGIVLS